MPDFPVTRSRQRESSLGRVGFSAALTLFVCLFFQAIISKTDAARITKLDTEIFQYESGKPIYFGVKRSVTSHK